VRGKLPVTLPQIWDRFEPTPDLAELGFGVAENERYIDLKTKAPDFYDGINRLYELNSLAGSGKPSYPEGESVAEIRARLEHFTQCLLSAYQGKCVAAVSHGGFIKYMVAYYLGLPLEQPIFITINNASLSIVDFLGSV
jgi:broad specificity phosphatase PhoE